MLASSPFGPHIFLAAEFRVPLRLDFLKADNSQGLCLDLLKGLGQRVFVVVMYKFCIYAYNDYMSLFLLLYFFPVICCFNQSLKHQIKFTVNFFYIFF